MPIPEKDFYTLDEIADYWACIGINKSSFLYLARNDLLVFSVYRRELGSYREVTETPKGILTRTNNVLISFRAPDFENTAIRYLRADDARRILEAKPGQEIAVIGLYSLPTRTRESGTGYSPSIYLTSEDLGISLSEKTRFENAHGYNSFKARSYRFWSWFKEPSNLKPLSLIGTGLMVVIGAVWTVFKLFYNE